MQRKDFRLLLLVNQMFLRGKYFVLKVPNNESNINIYDIINFYDCIYKNQEPSKVVENIRSKAEKCCEIRNTMKPIVEYMMKE